MTTKYDLSGDYHADVNALMNRISELDDALRLAEDPCRTFYKTGRDGGWKAYSAVQEALKPHTVEVSGKSSEPDRSVEAPALQMISESGFESSDRKPIAQHFADCIGMLSGKPSVYPIPCEVRLPTEDDADFNGEVWGWYQYRNEWLLVAPCVFVEGSDICTHWMPTGFTRPSIDPNKN